MRTFGHQVAATCCDCDMLGVTNRPLLPRPGQTTTTSCNIHKYCIKNWAIYKLDPATPNMLKHADSILKLGWLPMKERREWHILKAAHKAIYSHDWPRNLQLEQVRHARNLRSSSTINHASDTFQHSAAALFNSLPSNVKCCDNFKSVSKQTLCILRERCRNRAE